MFRSIPENCVDVSQIGYPHSRTQSPPSAPSAIVVRSRTSQYELCASVQPYRPYRTIGRGVFVIPCACGFGDEVVLAFVAAVGFVDQGDVMLQTWRIFRDGGLVLWEVLWDNTNPGTHRDNEFVGGINGGRTQTCRMCRDSSLVDGWDGRNGRAVLFLAAAEDEFFKKFFVCCGRKLRNVNVAHAVLAKQ